MRLREELKAESNIKIRLRHQLIEKVPGDTKIVLVVQKLHIISGSDIGVAPRREWKDLTIEDISEQVININDII